MKKIWMVSLVGALTALVGCDENTVASPDGTVVAKIAVASDNNYLGYCVMLDGKEVLKPSELGITVNGRNYGRDVKLGEGVSHSFSETYRFLGWHDTCVNEYNEVVYPVLDTSSGKELMKLAVRVFNDGVAYRYELSDAGSERKIEKEDSSWRLEPAAQVWYQTNVNCYEGEFETQAAASVQPAKVIGLPITVKHSSGAYLLLTEANVVNYTDLAVKGGPGVFNAYFHADKEGFVQKGEAVTPWRVTLVARDLNTLLNSDIVKNLCPPCSRPGLENATFAQPGRCIWQWLPAGCPVYTEQHDWYDKTKQLGFEYYLIDDGWRDWRDGDKDQWACLKEAISYGNSIGVKSAIWVHSKEVFNATTRMPYLKKVRDCGAVGIKIDFMPPANYHWTQWYEDTLKECADVGLFVDFHGAVKPSGRERTWPHELAREAIRGHEWHITRYKRVLKKSHDCILPFNRYVQGRADYTPMVFEPRELIHFTWARELAQGITFSAPFLCFGDRPGTYLANPMVELIKDIPAIWNETRVLAGSEIGQCVVLARRSGDKWFVAVMNGPAPRKITLDFSFLGDANQKWNMLGFADDPDSEKLDACVPIKQVTMARDKMILALRPGGGFACRLIKK